MTPRGDRSDVGSGAAPSVRHAGLLMAQRVLHLLAAGLFAVWVPRLLEPAGFGRYALLTSVGMWFALLGGLGAVSLIVREVPRFLGTGDTPGIRKLISSLLALRGATGLLTATGYVAVVALALGVRDWPSVLLIAGAIWTRTIGNACFALFLGLNQAARWGAGDLLRRWLTLLFVLIGVPLAGVRGACAGFLAADVVVLLVGLVQARTFLRWRDVDLSRRHLLPFLRTGGAFAGGNLLIALAQRSGETIVQLSTGTFVEVGYYGAAYAIYLTIGAALWQLAIAFAPFLVGEIEAGRPDVVVRWLERLLKWLVIVSVPVVLGSWTLGPVLVPLVLGQAYEPVALNLMPLSVALLAIAATSVGRVAALALNRPGLSAQAAGIELVVFWVLGLALTPRWGSLGACVAALAASALNATYLTATMRRSLRYSLAAPTKAILLSAAFLPMFWAGPTTAVAVGLFAAGLALYGTLLWRSGLVTSGEIAAARRVAFQRPVVRDAPVR